MIKEDLWTIDDARQLYNIHRWGEGYFDINSKGQLCACISVENNLIHIPLIEIVKQLKSEGLTLPVLVRFSNILHHRIQSLGQSFKLAIEKYAYQGQFTPVYPIKVNQQRRVVEEMLKTKHYKVGLEAGSKPELMAVLSLNTNRNQVILCNGYKDREYVRLALLGRVLGHKIFIIIEKMSEVRLVLEESQKLNIRPLLGLRARLSSIGQGKWQNSGGEKSKFGLTSSQILQMVEYLQQNNFLSCLKLLHCHLGSQVANLAEIEQALSEFAQTYVECHKLGAPLSVADVGGGLGVDYEGTRSRSDCSANYTFKEYADMVVKLFATVCNQNKLEHPDIITESGRAMVAHHAVLLTQIIEVEEPINQEPLPETKELANVPEVLNKLWKISQTQDEYSWVERYEVSKGLISKVNMLYAEGQLNLRQKAQAEALFNSLCHRVRSALSFGQRRHRLLLDELNEKLAHKLFCNFSLFQSIPDAWAIQQVFPIMPLEGLQKSPSIRAVIQDMTCDSDGRVDVYVDGEGVEHSLPLPPLLENTAQILGIFLVGAYQEILGDLHNLFGDTDSVHIEADESGSFKLVEPLLGDTVETLLKVVHFDPQKLMRTYKQQLEKAPLSPRQRKNYLDILSSGLSGYTYLEYED